MKTHRIDLKPAGADRAQMFWNGADIGISRQPLFDAARLLVKFGEAEPTDRIETWRGSTKCLSGPVWAAVQLKVSEDINSAPSFRKYESPEEMRARFRPRIAFKH